MDLRPVGVNGILAVLGDFRFAEQTGAQVAALPGKRLPTRISAAWKKPSPLMLHRC